MDTNLIISNERSGKRHLGFLLYLQLTRQLAETFLIKDNVSYWIPLPLIVNEVYMKVWTDFWIHVFRKSLKEMKRARMSASQGSPCCFLTFVTTDQRITETDLWLTLAKMVSWGMCESFQWMGHGLDLILNWKMRKFNVTLGGTVAFDNYLQKVAHFLHMWIKQNAD